MAELTDKQLLKEWNELVENIRKQTAMLLNETEAEQKKRIKDLEADPEQWFKYYFPQYCYAEPADFHKEATKRLLHNLEWYEVRMWSRELAKSTRAMMEILFLVLTGKKKYVLLISNSYDNGERLAAPFKANLEANQRIIHDYGIQETPGKWVQGEFTTRKGAAFRALGAGQSPRGTRNEENRPDVILFDDIDTDEDCRNLDTIHKKWEWIEQAAIGTRSISNQLTILFLGNKIAEDCCVVRACENADHVDEINIRDEHGNSTWPQKNTEEHINRVLSLISYATQQKEYYNNPLAEGKVFKELIYGKCPKLKELLFVVTYADPSPSNRDRPTSKAKIQNSCKAVAIVGYHNGRFYIYKIWVDQTTNSTFIDWQYAARDYIKDQTASYFYIENNSLQNPFYEQVYLPLIMQKGKEPGNTPLGVTPDDRDKPDKYFRIEGTLQPLHAAQQLVFNIDEKENPHMKTAEAQFKSVDANSKTMDAPDCVEGAVFIIKQKIMLLANDSMRIIKRPRNKKRL